MPVKDLLSEYKALAEPERIQDAQRFFKTGKGEYGEGDVFLGIRVPAIRQFAKQRKNTAIEDIEEILHSKYHEERLLAVIMLVNAFKSASQKQQKAIYTLYLKNTKYINNWDIVDSSAPNIVGAYLYQRDRKKLFTLANSKDLWEKRISVLATFYFIKHQDYTDSLKIAEKHLRDSHDLIHKAVGWMLREIGNRDLATEESFLKTHYKTMPRTMLRYAIEKFPAQKRKAYLQGNV